jgi:ubiquinone/menaquinone biosynthesis C-methylase UbiE
MAFESLYDNFIAEYYDLSPIVTGRKDIDFYVSAAKEFAEPVLELGCGSGRVTLAIAQAGFRITGLDLSPKMLAQAEEKITKLPDEVRPRVTLLQGNMANFALHERFRLVIIPFRSFQHLLRAAPVGLSGASQKAPGTKWSADSGLLSDRRAANARP